MSKGFRCLKQRAKVASSPHSHSIYKSPTAPQGQWPSSLLGSGDAAWDACTELSPLIAPQHLPPEAVASFCLMVVPVNNFLTFLFIAARQTVEQQHKLLSNLSLQAPYKNIWNNAILEKITHNLHSWQRKEQPLPFSTIWWDLVILLNTGGHPPNPRN